MQIYLIHPVEVCLTIMETIENRNPESNNGNTPLILALENKHFDLYNSLINNMKKQDEYK